MTFVNSATTTAAAVELHHLLGLYRAPHFEWSEPEPHHCRKCFAHWPADGGASLMNLAFLGCGQAARLHSQTLRSCDPTVRRFYASRDPVHAARFVRQFGGAGVCASYEAAIDRPDIDAVLITLPPALHLPWAQRALASGKHVIVEKPAFLSTAEFDVAAGAARAAGRQLLIAENYYYKLLFASLPKG